MFTISLVSITFSELMVQLTEHTDDQVLWKNIKAGGEPYFNLLFKRYYSDLYYYGIKIIPIPDFVKECIQEVFIRIWETRKSLGDVKNIKSYLIVSIRRMILSKKKDVKEKQAIEIGQIENYPFLFIENEFVKQEEISDEVRHVLLSAINSLTIKQRELVMLFFYHGLSYTEISQVIGVNLQSVRNLMHRTLTKLRKSVGKKITKPMSNLVFFLFSSAIVKK
ncbi:hypothetical protein MNBD_BACTEROID01-2241 [hydrothermal vent metagenome]|uniref:RNA polymerase ECF-type sigma factor n=1 Tax=hydrothermal vent metagenome TaxID=652676 RepID=A0A3B0UDB3_9ZZZZ